MQPPKRIGVYRPPRPTTHGPSSACRWRVVRTAVTVAFGVGPLLATAVRPQSVSNAPAGGADRQYADRGPEFLGSGAAARLDMSGAPVLRRQVTLDLFHVSLRVALDALARQAQLRFLIPSDVVALDHPVTLSATDITVAAAITQVLFGVGIDVRVSTDGRTLALVPRSPGMGDNGRVLMSHQATGTIRGRVTDATTHGAIANVTIAIASTARTVVTDAGGRFAFSGLAAGSYAVSARRLGYVATRQTVTVADSMPVTMDIILVAAPTVLDEVVTTMTGDQHIRELGNSIGVIGVDSVVATAPVRTLSDVLTARVPSVQVYAPGGLTGAVAPTIVRGLTSYNTFNAPLLYVDGIRVGNDNSTSNAYTPTFNDIAPEDIDQIEVVKGPSAAALYGTDAANGVIAITTKRGSTGPSRWTVFGEEGVVAAPTNEYRGLDNFYGWGHTPSGAYPQSCTDISVASNACVRDSTTHFSPLLTRAISPLGTGSRANYGGNVSGGSQQTRFFLSGDYSDEVGYLRMSPAFASALQQERGAIGVPGDERRPDFTTKYGVRANVNTVPISPVSLSASASYIAQQIGGDPRGTIIGYAYGGAGYAGPAAWLSSIDPSRLFAQRQLNSLSHSTLSGTIEWRPFSWFSARGIAGLDVIDEHYDNLMYPGDSTLDGGSQAGLKQDFTTNSYQYTYTGMATATLPITSALTSRTTIGGNYHRALSSGAQVRADSLGPGCATSGCALLPVAGSYGRGETIVAGSFFEQQLAFDHRLFVTGGLRIDAGSTFGNAYHAALYPKASVSWVAVQQPAGSALHALQSVRLRAAYGQSGTQPPPTAKLNTESTTPVLIKDTLVFGTGLPLYGAPGLQPERQREVEGGVDVDMLSGRVHLEGTLYDKRTTNALLALQAPASQGAYGQEVNVGSVQDRGYEGMITIRPIESRLVAWDVAANGSVNHNKLVSLGPQMSIGGIQQFFPSAVVGEPLYSWFDFPVTLTGGNQAGVILPTDLTMDSVERFIGPSYPATQVTGTTTLSLANNAVQVRAMVDYRGGFDELNVQRFTQDALAAGPAEFSSTAPLNQRVRAAALSLGSFHGYYENASFARLRELAITYNVPPSLTRTLPLRGLALTLSGRNLALWTRFGGLDPEDSGSQNNQQGNGAYGGVTGASLAPARYWLLRFSAQF